MKWIYHYPDESPYIDYFVNPFPGLAVLGMALNDHWGKRAYPSWVTGKISDFLGVFYFPILVCAVICLVLNFLVNPILKRNRRAYISSKMMIGAMALTCFLMMGIKLSPEIAFWVQTVFSESLFSIKLTPDPTDLVSFLILPLSYLYAKEFFAPRTFR